MPTEYSAAELAAWRDRGYRAGRRIPLRQWERNQLNTALAGGTPRGWEHISPLRREFMIGYFRQSSEQDQLIKETLDAL